MITMFNNVKILQKSIISFQFLKIIKKKKQDIFVYAFLKRGKTQTFVQFFYFQRFK